MVIRWCLLRWSVARPKDAPEVAVVAVLTHIRSRLWLEQMIARATRVDPNAGAYENQRALVYHPDDPLFAKFRQRVETEQGTAARRPKHKRQAELPLWLQERLAEQDREGAGGITPLESNALGLRDATLRPGPAFADVRPWPEKTQTDLIAPPSVLERRLRLRIGEMIADEAGLAVPRGRGRGLMRTDELLH